MRMRLEDVNLIEENGSNDGNNDDSNSENPLVFLHKFDSFKSKDPLKDLPNLSTYLFLWIGSYLIGSCLLLHLRPTDRFFLAHVDWCQIKNSRILFKIYVFKITNNISPKEEF